MPINTLSATQHAILKEAAGRPKHAVLPLPISVTIKGAVRTRLLTSLLKQGLVKEVTTKTQDVAWRTGDAGEHYTLKLTKEGLAAASAASEPEQQAAETLPVALPRRPSGKLGDVLNALSDKQGATLAQLVSLTGWLPHTTRAALTRLKQRGYPVELVKTVDRKSYQLVQAHGS